MAKRDDNDEERELRVREVMERARRLQQLELKKRGQKKVVGKKAGAKK
jgi:hypothetical protein